MYCPVWFEKIKILLPIYKNTIFEKSIIINSAENSILTIFISNIFNNTCMFFYDDGKVLVSNIGWNIVEEFYFQDSQYQKISENTCIKKLIAFALYDKEVEMKLNEILDEEIIRWI